jgi:hypothetical protein
MCIKTSFSYDFDSSKCFRLFVQAPSYFRISTSSNNSWEFVVILDIAQVVLHKLCIVHCQSAFLAQLRKCTFS